MDNLYELRGVPNSWVMHDDDLPDYVVVCDQDDENGTFDHPNGLTRADLWLWGRAEYWTTTEAALLLAGIPPNSFELYAVSREVREDGGVETVDYMWKYYFEFHCARENLFLFERLSLAPKAPPCEWVKYFEKLVREAQSDPVTTREYGFAWTEFFSAKLNETSAVEKSVPRVADNPGRRERQWDVMRAVCAALKFDPLQIPDGGCAELKSACLSLPLLFTDEGFEHAWKAGKKKNLFKMANREKFSPK